MTEKRDTVFEDGAVNIRVVPYTIRQYVVRSDAVVNVPNT